MLNILMAVIAAVGLLQIIFAFYLVFRRKRIKRKINALKSYY